MNKKTINTLYWIATGIFVLWLVFDGIGGVLMIQAGKDSLTYLGYPLYLLVPMGFAKLLAAVAILQTRFRVVKEWAFAGYAINCLGACVSRIAVGDSIVLILMPLIFLAIMFIPYVLWKKRSS
jgi:hypothetical protein